MIKIKIMFYYTVMELQIIFWLNVIKHITMNKTSFICIAPQSLPYVTLWTLPKKSRNLLRYSSLTWFLWAISKIENYHGAHQFLTTFLTVYSTNNIWINEMKRIFQNISFQTGMLSRLQNRPPCWTAPPTTKNTSF